MRRPARSGVPVSSGCQSRSVGRVMGGEWLATCSQHHAGGRRAASSGRAAAGCPFGWRVVRLSPGGWDAYTLASDRLRAILKAGVLTAGWPRQADDQSRQPPAGSRCACRQEVAMTNLWWKAEPVAWERGGSPALAGSETYSPFFVARMSRLNALRACRWL